MKAVSQPKFGEVRLTQLMTRKVDFKAGLVAGSAGVPACSTELRDLMLTGQARTPALPAAGPEVVEVTKGLR